MEKIVEKKIIHQSRVGTFEIRTVELPSGKRVTREVWVRPPGVLVMALDDQGNILLTREFRSAAERIQWDLPRGYIEPDETPQEAAMRELKEETGFVAGRTRLLHKEETTSGYMQAVSYFYIAEGLERNEKEGGDEDHEIEVVVMPLEEAFRVILEDEIEAVPPLIVKALLLLRKHFDKKT